MKKHLTRIALAVFLAVPSLTLAGEIAITLDDLPYLRPGKTTPEQGLAQVHAINRALAEHNITATGFVIGQNITPKTRAALDRFVAAGHRVGNHSWSHPAYDKISTWRFRNETRRTDLALAPWINAPKYYRFPYLREGKSDGAKVAAKRILAKLGYRNAPVSIDNAEWKFNADYVDALALGDTRTAEQIATRYLAHMKERTEYFQTLAHRVLGRDVKHILLLHMNQLNADHLHRLLDWYAAQGWRFIPLQTAMADPIYDMPDRYSGWRGVSQIERIAGSDND